MYRTTTVCFPSGPLPVPGDKFFSTILPLKGLLSCHTNPKPTRQAALTHEVVWSDIWMEEWMDRWMDGSGKDGKARQGKATKQQAT